MRRTQVAAVALGALALIPAAPAGAAGVAYPDADWTQATITEKDGTALHADVLRPKGAKDGDKTPVVLSIGPYFNHSGQTGPAGPAESTSYDPIGPSAGPSERFADFVEGSGLLKKGYSFVMVDLRGFGGSSGCLDWGGPGEQADVAAAIEWAAKQPWSTGAVGTYGKSYDAMTGLIAAGLRPAGLGAVVAQEPVYDDYRYLYGDGIRRENSAATPALYDAIDETPGPVADGDPNYLADGANDTARPGCAAQNWADQQDDDHTSEYWKQRDLIAKNQGSNVPVFLTQGLTENNTAPDGLAQFLAAHAGPERAWLGPWEHVRGAETCAKGDGSTGCTDKNVGRLKQGRKGFYDEVLAFYDQYLKGGPADTYPNFAVQTNDGRWRAEDQWPPADATTYTTTLEGGTYDDTAQSAGTDANGDASSGVWTVSAPLDHEVHLSGSPTVTLDVTTTDADANLVVDIYDVNQNGKGPLVSRQGRLVRDAGHQQVRLEMMSADWKFAVGHRIGVRVTDNNQEWWLLAKPSNQTVTVNGGSIAIPFLRDARSATIQGDPGVQLESYLRDVATAPIEAVEQPAAFDLPPAQAPAAAAPAPVSGSSKAKAKRHHKAKHRHKAHRKSRKHKHRRKHHRRKNR